MITVVFAAWTKDSVDDLGFLNNLISNYICNLPNRDLATLKKLKSSLTSYQNNRIDHLLQTALFEERDGADIEIIVATLSHDVGNH